MGNLPPKPAPESEISLSTLVFRAWRDLLSSRDQVLRRFYIEQLRMRGLCPTKAMTLDEARSEQLVPGGSADREANLPVERMIVRSMRLSAGWIVLWASGPLLLFILVFGVHFAKTAATRTAGQNAMFLMLLPASIPLLYIAGVFGLFVQQIFMHPFNAFANWLCNCNAGDTPSSLAPLKTLQPTAVNEDRGVD